MSTSAQSVPWYRRVRRWAQTNLTEIDPVRCDVGFWRDFWRENHIQGIIVNAAGIVAYYPSSNPMQYRAKYLGERDLLGEFVLAAREEGLAVLARMDINRVTAECRAAHPEWIAMHTDGTPYTAGDRFLTCICSSYYREHTPTIFREIIDRYHPDGFTDNSWSGINDICHCPNCSASFRAYSGMDLPCDRNWDDPAFLQWILWSRSVRTENWKLFNRSVREWGGEDCLWLGMIHGNPPAQDDALCDLAEVLADAPAVMLDCQGREAVTGFELNGMLGGLIRNLTGCDALMPESMSNYARAGMTFRRAANPAGEARLWMAEGIAAGISPWTHFVGGAQEDRRMLSVPTPIMKWHKENERYLYDRTPLAGIGVVWSQDNALFYGRDDAAEMASLPFVGFTHALIRARMQFVPVHASRVHSLDAEIRTLVLPDVAAMGDSELESVCDFIRRGGNIVYTGLTGALDGLGRPRTAFPLDALCGIRRRKAEIIRPSASMTWADSSSHSYLRLPAERHPILMGFEDTDILPFGGILHNVEPAGLTTVAEYIPPFPIYPPEFSYTWTETSGRPVILAGESGFGGRAVYLAGDIDRNYGRTRLPDLGDVLAGCVRWAAGEQAVEIHAEAYLDCKAYRQERRVIVHLVNLTGAGQWPAYAEYALPIGKVDINLRLDGFEPERALMTVSGREASVERDEKAVRVTLDGFVGHEMVVIE